MKFILLNKPILTLLFACILLTACEKIDVPDPDKENPVFEVSFEDGVSNINIGGPNTELVSIVTWDDLDIRTFEGSLVNTKNQSSLTFRLRDDRLTKPGTVEDTLSLFIPRNYTYVNITQHVGEQTVLLNQLHNMEYHDRVIWQYGILPDAYGAFFNIINFNPNIQTSFCMKIMDEVSNKETNYCKSMVYNKSEIPFKGFSLANNEISPMIDPSFTGDIEFEWNGVKKRSFIIENNGKLAFSATHNPENNDQTAAIHSSDMFVDLDSQGNAIIPIIPGFDSKLVVFDRSPDLSKVEIIWVNEEGKEFKSSNASQSDLADFIIKDVKHFSIRNQDGHRVMKVEVNFSCTLQAEDGETIQIQDGKGTIGFAYY